MWILEPSWKITKSSYEISSIISTTHYTHFCQWGFTYAVKFLTAKTSSIKHWRSLDPFAFAGQWVCFSTRLTFACHEISSQSVSRMTWAVSHPIPASCACVLTIAIMDPTVTYFLKHRLFELFNMAYGHIRTFKLLDSQTDVCIVNYLIVTGHYAILRLQERIIWYNFFWYKKHIADSLLSAIRYS